MQSIPFSEARAHLAEALRSVELKQEPLIISRRGQAAGVLVPVSQYNKLAGSEVGFVERLTLWREAHAASSIEPSDADLIDPARDPSPGRAFSW